jgi:acyl-coenzyme A thioesterase PaaI-like protein
MSSSARGPRPGVPELNGLTAAWLGREELGEQPAFAALIEALRTLQDQVTGSAPPAGVLEDAARRLTGLSRQLARYPVDERGQIAGQLADVPGHGQALIPPVTLDELADGRARGRVTFGRYYLGGGGAVHGGAIPLVFDQVMGMLANLGRSAARTAYLNVSYRSIAPIETELTVAARLESETGRKRLMRAVLRDGDTGCAEAEALFVALRPGQP